jgi:hypothetical protein
MEIPNERMAHSSGETIPPSEKTQKKPWTTPILKTIPLHSALGGLDGPNCDLYGSLSHGKHCPAT